MATRTTWAETLADIDSAIKNAVDNGSYKVLSVTTVDGVTTQYATLQDLIDYRETIVDLANAETPTTNVINSAYSPIMFRRTHA